MKSPQEVQAEYDEFRRLSPNTKLDVKGFAQFMDSQEGRPNREAVYNDTWYKKLNRAIDVPFNYTPAPGVIASPAEAFGTVGSGLGGLVDSALGTKVAPVVEQVGRDTPRMITESLATIPLVASGAGAPTAAAMWANRARRLGQIAGYGSAATRGYAETDSPAGAVIAAGQMYGANKLLLPKEYGGVDVGGKAERAVTKFLDKSGDYVPGTPLAPTSGLSRLAGPATRTAADVGTATGLNEVTRQGMLSVGPNAVGPTDPARNPLTEENIAANVAGAAAFLPQIVTSFRHPAQVSPKQQEQLHNFLTAKQDFTKIVTGEATQGELPLRAKSQAAGTEGTPKSPVLDPTRSEALYGILRSELDSASRFEADGNVAEATRARENALLAINEISSRGTENLPPEFMERVKSAIDTEARSQGPQTPEGFEKFVGEVRSIIDTLNEGRVSYEQELANREANLNRNDKKAVAEFESWKKSQAANIGKSWHPNARDPLVVDRLWSSGNLKPLTPEWLESEWNATFDASGDPQFAVRVVAQKVANYAMDRIPTALEAEAATRKAQTVRSERVTKLTENDHKFARALGRLPDDIKNAVFQRTIDIQRNSNFSPGQAEKMGVTEGVRIDKRSGRQMTAYPEWQKAVIQAMESYDPESGTILMKSRGGKYIRVPYRRLVEKSPNGGYVWEPFETPLPTGAGGKSVVKGLPEGNIEALETKTSQDAAGAITDEEAFKQTLAEEGGIGLGRADMTDAERLGTMEDTEKVNPAENVVDDVTLAAETNLSERMKARAQEIKKGLSALSDEELWKLAKDEFQFRNSVQAEMKKADIRLALEAALENLESGTERGITPKGREFLARLRERGNTTTRGKGELDDVKLMLRNFFQFKNPVQASTGKLPNHVERLARILRKVLDPQAIARTKSELKPTVKMRGGPGEEPLYRFSAPVRLERWLAGKGGMGYTPDALGRIPSKSVVPLLTKLGIGKDEMALYKAAGIDGLLGEGKQVGVKELSQWMQENTPKIEVKKLLPNDANAENEARSRLIESERRFNAAQHQVETLGYRLITEEGFKFGSLTNGNIDLVEQGGIIYEYPTGYNRSSVEGKLSDYPKEVQNFFKARSEYESWAQREPDKLSDAATGRYGVEPKELKDMPGAVDILVRLPSGSLTDSLLSGNRFDQDFANRNPILYKGPHFGESDYNVLVSLRAYVETLPSGEKVLHVFEVQSDWGQKISGLKQKGFKSGREGQMIRDVPGRQPGTRDYSYVNVSDHPLLEVYEQLGLKAAIDHAKSLGIKKVAVSDAETAMMTEGHDRYARMTNETDAQGRVIGAGRPEISQEPGMRAAYDSRLPFKMEKLTGGKGQMVDLGVHKTAFDPRDGSVLGESLKKGSPVFNNKTSVTARLYDISSTPDEFSVFGYGRPKVDEGGTSGKNIIPDETMVNPPAPGQFVQDVERTMRVVIEQRLGRLGYSGTSKEFLTEVAVALAQQGEMFDMDFYRTTPTYGVAWPGEKGESRPALGLNVDRITDQSAKRIVGLLQTLGHEIMHMDGFLKQGLIPKPDAYSDDRRRAVENMYYLAERLTPDERHVMRKMMTDALPEHLQEKIYEKDGSYYGTSSAEEFVSEMTGDVLRLLLLDTPQGRAFAKETVDMLPPEAREYTRSTFRTVRDVLATMQEATSGEFYKSQGLDNFVLSKGFEAIVDSATTMTDLRHADQSLAIARSFIESLTPGGGVRPPPQMTNAVWFREAKNVNDVQKEKFKLDVPLSETAVEAINEVTRAFSPRKFDKAHTPSKFAQWIYPFANLMVNMERKGIPLARDVLNSVFSLEPGISRMYSGMMRGFLKQKPDGSFDFNADHPLVRAVSEDPNGRWRKQGVDAVSRWQQEHETKSMFIKDQQGNIIPNPNVKGAATEWERIRGQLSKEDQQWVPAISVALDEANQAAAKYITTNIHQSNVGIVATYLMAADKRLTYDQALQQAQAYHDAFLSGNVLSLRGTPPKMLEALEKLLIGKKTEATPNGDGLIPKFLEVAKLLENRPGFRSESLPGDWIIKYSTPVGEIKYASAPLEMQALHLANRLRNEGNQIIGEVAHRNDLRTLNEFDNPDTILMKVAETERFVYERFVKDMEAEYGTVLGDALRDGYQPVGQSLKELGTQGLNKFLRERKALVDREKFDYIDGTMMYLHRLSASLAMRGVQQQLRLILNDPRARLLPSFRKMVNEHVTEMTQPRTDFHKKAAAFTTTYMMGANLSSAIVNGTQSLVTLVPWLISGIDTRYATKGSVVKGWKDMTKAMSDALWVSTGDEWKGLARDAEGKDPKNWTSDEALAALYRRHVTGGGISQTVIDDLMYGRDRQMMLNAKFGHGNYGPTPISKLVSDKMYMGSQMMMSMYRVVEHFNAKTAFAAGIRQGHELGLRGDELYNYGVRMQTLATFGGGRANAPGITGARWAREGQLGMRSAVGLVNALQQYGYGSLAMYGQLGKDAIGASRALDPLQRRAAQKAFGTMLMTQTAMAGMLGLPFVGAGLTALEKVFGFPANQAVRETLAGLGQDDDQGAVIAETSMNGIWNQMFGLDLSSRLGTSNILGTSAYRGFDLRDMAGPSLSIMGNAAEALNLFGQNKPVEAARSLVPTAFKNVIEMSDTKAKYGDAGFRDKAGNLLYTPTEAQQWAYGFGLRPRELSQKRQLAQLTSLADERVNTVRGNRLNSAAQALLQGDPMPARRLAMEQSSTDRTFDATEQLRQIMNRAIAMQTEKDELASGSRYNEQERLSLAKTFGSDINTRRSELDAQRLRLALARQLGDPRLAPTLDSYKQAAMIDRFVQANGMPRSQAVRLVEFLNPR